MATFASSSPMDEDEVSLLEWLRLQADQNVPEAFLTAAIPVAWLGRTSTDDSQDPTLSLPRQLENTRKALPPGFVIVAKFYDVESGRTTMENRGRSNAHEQLDIPIARDGSIADLLEEAKLPNRRFVAVVCESIERVARVTYYSTKIEYELEKAGVALLAADEGIDPKSIPSLNAGNAPFRRATSTLTRRIKQAIAEWYVLNMLELSWGGLKAHTAQGFNIGKPPYGYLASKVRHPVKAKAREGKTKHRLVLDPVRGPAVTQIFMWRALERIGYDEIAKRLNLDPERFPPPDPILGEGRRRIGCWIGGSVREVLDNPKHTGYMVWNRRKRGHREREVKGGANPPSHWVWSPLPTHEPSVTRELFAAASTVGRYGKGSRSTSAPQLGQRMMRNYRLRSYVLCDKCDRRYCGELQKGLIYYRCTPNPKNHSHLHWFAEYPKAAMVREDLMTEPLERFLRHRVFGTKRMSLLSSAADDGTAAKALTTRRDKIVVEIAELQRRQSNLLNELECFESTGDSDVDTELRGGIKDRFAVIVNDLKGKKGQLATIDDELGSVMTSDFTLLEEIPTLDFSLDPLNTDQQRRLFDALHLEMIFHPLRRDLHIRVTLDRETAADLNFTVTRALYPAGTFDPVRNAKRVESSVMHSAPPAAHNPDFPERPLTCGDLPFQPLSGCGCRPQAAVWSPGFLDDYR